MVEPKFKPSPLSIQVMRETVELTVKHNQDYCIVDVIGSYQNEKFGEAMEWIVEVHKFINVIRPQMGYDPQDSYSCHNMLLRIRKIRAKRGANFTFQRVRDDGSSSINMRTMEPLSLREELYCEITSLINTYYPLLSVVQSLHGLPQYEFIEDTDKQMINEVSQFLLEIKQQLQEKILETRSDWYLNKIAEARTLIEKWEPEFCLQSQDVGSSTINMPIMAPLSLHEDLHCELKLLANIYCVDMWLTVVIIKSQDPHHLRDTYLKEVQELMNETDKFVTETSLQSVEKNPGKNSDWYHKKIAESRMLISKRYSAFPLRSQDVGYTNEQFQIFLSFRGEDTRYNFTRYLYDALHEEGFKVFMDDEGLQSGDSISQVLMGEIEKSKISIIVFSKNFATSTWCLDEVVKILECNHKNNQQVWPIFYKVEPSDVRHQRNSYAKALIKQETRFGKDSDKVKNWRSALNEVCGFKAFHYKKNSGYESAFIQDIIKGAKNIRDHL